MADNPQDLQEIYQRTIDMDILDKYFHAKTLPERKPLLILKNEYIGPEPSLVSNLVHPCSMSPAMNSKKIHARTWNSRTSQSAKIVLMSSFFIHQKDLSVE
jgi:hypothetical protein